MLTTQQQETTPSEYNEDGDASNISDYWIWAIAISLAVSITIILLCVGVRKKLTLNTANGPQKLITNEISEGNDNEKENDDEDDEDDDNDKDNNDNNDDEKENVVEIVNNDEIHNDDLNDPDDIKTIDDEKENEEQIEMIEENKKNENSKNNSIKQGFKNLISMIDTNRNHIKYTKSFFDGHDDIDTDDTTSTSGNNDDDTDIYINDDDEYKIFYSIKRSDGHDTLNTFKTKSLSILLNLSKRIKATQKLHQKEVNYSEQDIAKLSDDELSDDQIQLGLKSGLYQLPI